GVRVDGGDERRPAHQEQRRCADRGTPQGVGLHPVLARADGDLPKLLEPERPRGERCPGQALAPEDDPGEVHEAPRGPTVVDVERLAGGRLTLVVDAGPASLAALDAER